MTFRQPVASSCQSLRHADRIRRLPFGTGIILLRSAPPIITDLRPWPGRSDAKQLTADRAEIEALLRRG